MDWKWQIWQRVDQKSEAHNGSNSKLITVVCDDAQTRDYVSVLVV